MEVRYLVPQHAVKTQQPITPPDFSSLKEPAEAFEVLSLENLTSNILQRKDLSQWEKAHLLGKNLERFLSLKRNVVPDQPIPTPPPPKLFNFSPLPASTPTVKTTPNREKSKRKREVTLNPTPSPVGRSRYKLRDRKKKIQQHGTGSLRQIHWLTW